MTNSIIIFTHFENFFKNFSLKISHPEHEHSWTDPNRHFQNFRDFWKFFQNLEVTQTSSRDWSHDLPIDVNFYTVNKVWRKLCHFYHQLWHFFDFNKFDGSLWCDNVCTRFLWRRRNFLEFRQRRVKSRVKCVTQMDEIFFILNRAWYYHKHIGYTVTSQLWHYSHRYQFVTTVTFGWLKYATKSVLISDNAFQYNLYCISH